MSFFVQKIANKKNDFPTKETTKIWNNKRHTNNKETYKNILWIVIYKISESKIISLELLIIFIFAVLFWHFEIGKCLIYIKYMQRKHIHHSIVKLLFSCT